MTAKNYGSTPQNIRMPENVYFRENYAPTASYQFCAVVLEVNSYHIMQPPVW